MKTGKEIFFTTEDADDLLLLTFPDEVSPEVFDGMVWAIKNRSVNWPLHLNPANPPKTREAARRLLEAAGMTHLLKTFG